MNTFRTHTGETVTGDRLQAALGRVADDWAALAHAIRKEDDYAPHVSEAAKDAALADGLAFAEKIRRGEATSLTVWQRINTALTGECIALLA